MQIDVLSHVLEMNVKGKRCSLVTVTHKSGSAPGDEGRIMAVSEESVVGTIGGGPVEHDVIEKSREALKTGKNFSFEYDLASDGMSCGGKLKGYANIMKPKTKLYIFGGGHVSQNLAKAAQILDFDTIAIDDRPEFSDCFQNYVCKDISEIDFCFDNSFVVLANRSHEHDLRSMKLVVKQNPEYIGMIGSKRKVTEIFKELDKEGVSDNIKSKICAPVGLDISDGTPEEIAIAILAEILMVKNKKALKQLKI